MRERERVCVCARVCACVCACFGVGATGKRNQLLGGGGAVWAASPPYARVARSQSAWSSGASPTPEGVHLAMTMMMTMVVVVMVVVMAQLNGCCELTGVGANATMRHAKGRKKEGRGEEQAVARQVKPS